MYGTRAYDDGETPICSQVDVKVDVEKSHDALRVRSSVSPISVYLRYAEWVSILEVFRCNVGQRIDKSQWDNLEVAWERNGVLVETSPRYSRDVAYAEDARIVRFGTARKPPPTANSAVRELELSLECERLGLLLRRDDAANLNGDGARRFMNVALFVLQGLASTFSQRVIGLQSASFSVRQVFVFDLGSSRNGSVSSQSEECVSSPHSVLVEGYGDRVAGDSFDSQIVLTIDRSESSSSEISASLLMNYISVAAIASPIDDVVNFFACRWESPVAQMAAAHLPPIDEVTTFDAAPAAPDSPPTASCFSLVHVKLVLHYPRFVFVLDENDRHSRAIVLEGYVAFLQCPGIWSRVCLLTGFLQVSDGKCFGTHEGRRRRHYAACSRRLSRRLELRESGCVHRHDFLPTA